MWRHFEQARVVTRVPAELGRLGVRTVHWSSQRMIGCTTARLLGVGRVLALGNEQHIAERLEATRPLSEVRLGAEDVIRGLETDDPELTKIGGREVARGVVLARQKPEIAGRVVDIKRGLPVDALDSPLVSPELADEARAVIDRFGNTNRLDGEQPSAE